jgi:hypothetical protein
MSCRCTASKSIAIHLRPSCLVSHAQRGNSTDLRRSRARPRERVQAADHQRHRRRRRGPDAGSVRYEAAQRFVALLLSCHPNVGAALDRDEFLITTDFLGSLFRNTTTGAAPRSNVLLDPFLACIGAVSPLRFGCSPPTRFADCSPGLAKNNRHPGCQLRQEAGLALIFGLCRGIRIPLMQFYLHHPRLASVCIGWPIRTLRASSRFHSPPFVFAGQETRWSSPKPARHPPDTRLGPLPRLARCR